MYLVNKNAHEIRGTVANTVELDVLDISIELGQSKAMKGQLAVAMVTSKEHAWLLLSVLGKEQENYLK